MAWRTGYFYGQGFGGLSVANIPYSDYTHILYESISPNGGGGIDTSPANLSEVDTFVTNCHGAGVKALICLGVADAGSWQGSTNSGNVASFAAAVASFVSAHNLDGVDLDWESGINVSQYADFIQRLRAALGSSKVISIAVYGGGGANPKAAVVAAGPNNFDQVNLMSYDMGIYEARSWFNTAIHSGPNGEWSIDATISEFVAAGIPVGKLGIGIPFYGLSFSGDTGALQGHTYSGSPAFSSINTSGNVYDATYGGQGVVTGGSWVTYAGPTLISAIVSYGAGAGVGGYMTFPINWEDSGHTLSAALASATGSSTPTVPTIYSFSASPATVTSAANSVLSWSVSGATSLSIDNGIGTVTGSTHTVNPTVTTTYTLTATNTTGPVTKSVTVTVGSGAPTIQSFTASPSNFIPGASVTLSWSTSLASSLSIDNGVGTVTGTSAVVTPGVTTTYTLTATNGSGSVTATVTATAGSTAALGSPALPVIQSFSAGSTAITQGASTTLSFSVLGAGVKGVTITPDIGVVSGSSVTVTPLTTTTFTLTAQNGTGAVAQSVQIVVHGSVGENIRVHQIRRDERHGDSQILQASDGTGIVRHLGAFNINGSLTDSGIDAADLLKSAVQPYHVVFYLPGPLTAGVAEPEPVMQWTCPADLADGVSFASAFGGFAEGFLQDNPASTATCNIYRVAAGSTAGTLGTLIGSIVISTAGAFTFSLTAESFVAGDSMTVWPPSPADSTLAGVGWTLPGTRGPTSSVGTGSGTGGTGGGTGDGSAITVNGTATILINGVGVSFDDTVLVNGV